MIKAVFMLSTSGPGRSASPGAPRGSAAALPRLVPGLLGLLALVDLPFLVYRGAVGFF